MHCANSNAVRRCPCAAGRSRRRRWTLLLARNAAVAAPNAATPARAAAGPRSTWPAPASRPGRRGPRSLPCGGLQRRDPVRQPAARHGQPVAGRHQPVSPLEMPETTWPEGTCSAALTMWPVWSSKKKSGSNSRRKSALGQATQEHGFIDLDLPIHQGADGALVRWRAACRDQAVRSRMPRQGPRCRRCRASSSGLKGPGASGVAARSRSWLWKASRPWAW
jgi:hypothetical protein